MSEKQPKILIIDDDPDFLEIFSTKIKASGFETKTCDNGKSGIAAAKSFKPNLILLDVEMPEMNGVETLSKIKKDENLKNVKVAFLTNYGEPQKEATWLDEKFAREAGAVDYIKKSDDLKSVVEQVKNILGDRERD